MFGNLFSSLAMKISGGAILALAVALAVTMWRADSISKDRDNLRDLVATERANHAVTRASLDTLANELEGMVIDGELRAERLAEALVAQERETRTLRAEAALIAADGPAVDCVTPDSILNAGGI